MKNNKTTINGRIRASKILKDPLNNIPISQIISQDFNNTKTREELEALKKEAQKSMKTVFRLLYSSIVVFWIGGYYLLLVLSHLDLLKQPIDQ